MSGQENRQAMGAGAAGVRTTGECDSMGGRRARRQLPQDQPGEESRKGSRRSESRLRKSGSPPALGPRVNGQRQRGLIRNQQGPPHFSFVNSRAVVMNQEETQSPGCPSLGPPSACCSSLP